MKMFSLCLSDISDSQLDKWFCAMEQSRKTAVDRIKVEEKRKAKIAADHLCRSAISEFCGVSENDISLCIGEHGKPYAANLPVFFSISHSGELVICCVSEKEIGADIEKRRPVHPRSAERFASERELKYISEFGEKAFFEIWTLKEAYFKCIGTGLGADIRNVEFSVTENAVICSEDGYGCFLLDSFPGYSCAVCEKIK